MYIIASAMLHMQSVTNLPTHNKTIKNVNNHILDFLTDVVHTLFKAILTVWTTSDVNNNSHFVVIYYTSL